MKSIIFLVSMTTLFGCASVEKLSSSDHCEVWEDKLLFGITNVSVGNGNASWSGNCKKLWWECKRVSAYVKKDTRDVYLSVSDDHKLNWDPEKPIGKIVNNEFKYNDKNPLEKYISYSPMVVDMNKYIVSYIVRVPLINQENTVKYNFNNKCNSDDALLGALAVGAVRKLKSETIEQPR